MNDDSTGVRRREAGGGGGFIYNILFAFLCESCECACLVICLYMMYIRVYTLDGKSSIRLFYDPTVHYLEVWNNMCTSRL